MSVLGGIPAAVSADLTPYVPRLLVEWLADDPDREWRELDGSMAFVDISGFTAMSEKLAGEGKAGAEQVSDVMNATFARLLDVAYAYGGGLLKFGGDALLLFFDGDEHEARAARASYEMRRALRAIGRPRTSAGTVTLKMHVGIHSGEFLFVLAGSDHRELIVTGPGASATVAMEAAAAAGEIAVSAATAAAMPADVLGERRADGFLLAGAPPAHEIARPLPATHGLELDTAVPRPIRDHVTSGTAEPEHRQAAIAFLRLSGTDTLAIEDGPEAAATCVADVVDSVQAACVEHGVCFLESDVDDDGARIVLVAGAPRTSEEDLERILRTVRAAVDAETELPLAVGVSYGRVFAGQVGAEFRRTYTILGGTAALAARLMAKAAPRQILVPAELLEKVETRFDAEPVAPLALKGLAEPVEAVALGAIAGTRRDAVPATSTPLVGRTRELAVMTAALAPVRMGFGTLLEIAGDAGVGKSRLLQEFRAGAADMRRIGARCDQYESSTPYFVFRSLLRPLVGGPDASEHETAAALEGLVERVAPHLRPWLPLLALPLDVDVPPTQEVLDLQPAFRRARLHGVVEELLGALLPDATLILLEDVHWIDEASSELLRHLAATNTARPWAICCTRRPGDEGFVAAAGTPPVAAMSILLEPLHDDEAAELVRAAAGGTLDDDAVAAIVRRAAGNPLFLQELVATAGHEGTEDLPDTVAAVVSTRIDRLTADDRALLRWASVLGLLFDGEVIADVLEGDPIAAGDSDAWERLREFVERDPYVAGGFRFRHALIRDAAYEGLAFRRRRELHQRVGEVYERRHAGSLDDVAELLSLHFWLAGDAPRTWEYSLRAGERAQEKFATAEAAEFYRRALDAGPTLDVPADERARAWRSLAEVTALAGDLASAKPALARARALAAPSEQPKLMLQEGLIREEEGLYSDALRWYTRGGKALAQVEDEDERAHMGLELARARAQARFRQGRYDEALQLAADVVTRALELEDLRNLAHGYYLSHVIHTMRGSAERHAFRGLALPIYEEIGDLVGQASVLNNLGIEAYYEGRWDEARDLYERSRALRERIGDVINVATTTNNVGEIDSDQGRFEDAERRFRETMRIADSAGHRLLSAVARGNLGRVAARVGNYADAEELLTQALTSFQEIGAEPFVLELLARRAELAALRGDDAALTMQLAEETLARPDVTPAVHALLERVRGSMLARTQEGARAREALARALEIAEGAQVEYEAGLARRSLAALDGADTDSDAAAIFDRLGVDVTALPLL